MQLYVFIDFAILSGSKDIPVCEINTSSHSIDF